MPTRLSFFLTDAGPDDQLLRSATSGALTGVDERRRQIDRLLASTGKRGVRAFFSDLLQLALLNDQPPSAAALPSAPPIAQAMREETLRTVEDLVFVRDADFRGLYDQNVTFVNRALATIYGLPAPKKDFDAVTISTAQPRAGLLGQGSFLARHAKGPVSSPTKRGRFIRQTLLCQNVPPPPPDITTGLPDEVAKSMALTTRAKLEIHRQVPACSACHALIDPLGFAFENFDGLGSYRATEAGQPIDASGTLDGIAFKDARELGTVLRNSPAIAACLVRTMVRSAIGRLETEADLPAFEGLLKKSEAGGFRMKALITEIALSPLFASVRGEP